MIKFIFLLTISLPSFANLNFSKDLSLNALPLKVLKNEVSEGIFSNNRWPKNIEIEGRDVQIDYTFNEKLTKYINRELRRYRSDYAAVVVIDNSNGEVLAATDYTRASRKFGKSLVFSNTNPAASVFKIITAADVIENSDVTEKTKTHFNGRGTTLYKSQLKKGRNRWSRAVTFDKAFAYSNNVVFGKVARSHTTIDSLSKTALKFGFGENNLLQMIDFGDSNLFLPNTDYGLAEFASGFNRKTTLSPLHGAILAGIIANDGIYRQSSIIKSLKDKSFEQKIWKSRYVKKRVISKETAKELQKLMSKTVTGGTARGAFRPWKNKRLKTFEIGGKTGSITGGFPKGKRDWFVSYAKPDINDPGISVCVMINNVKKWYIKSSYLTRNVIDYYYRAVKVKK